MKIWKREYYEKLLAEQTGAGTVQELHRQIQEAQKKIEELQSACSHDKFEVVFYSWRAGAMQPSHVCTGCRKYLGGATEEESKKLWDKFYQRTDTATGVDTK